MQYNNTTSNITKEKWIPPYCASIMFILIYKSKNLGDYYYYYYFVSFVVRKNIHVLNYD